MAQFLLACWSFETHSDVFLAVGHALRKQGHDVAFYTAPPERERVEAIGARFFPFQELSQEHADHLIGGVLRYRKRPWRLWQWWRRFLLDTIPAQVRDINAVVAKYAPDVIVADKALWALPLVLREQCPIPVVVLSHIALCLQPGDAGPVPGRAMAPRRTWFERLVARSFDVMSAFATRDAMRTATRIRADYGLPAVTRRVTELLGTMDLYLIPTCPSFDYSRIDLPPSVKYVGPCLWPPVPNRPPHRELREIRPRVLVEEGSLYTEDAVLLRAAIAGLANLRADVTIVAGRGRDIASLGSGELAPNIKIRPWKPLVELIRDADVVVSNGNSDSAMAALSGGVPLLVVPSILDQAEIAMRVSVCGAGITISERNCTPAHVRSAVELLLAEPAYQRQAMRMAAELNSLGGPKLAVQLLENLAARCGAAA